MAVFDMFRGSSKPMENPELDKTKEDLYKLKDQLDQGAQKTSKQIFDSVLPGFMKDLGELGITDKVQIAGYCTRLELAFNAEMVKETPDFLDLNNFLDNPHNLNGLEDVISGKKSEYEISQQLQTAAKAYPKLSWLPTFAPAFAMTMRYLNAKEDAKAHGKELGAIEGIWAALGIGGGKGKKVEKNETPTQALASWMKTTFKKNGDMDFNDATVEADLAELAKDGVKEDGVRKLAEEAVADNGKVRQLHEAISSGYGKVPFRLLDLRFQKVMLPNHIDTLIKAIKKDDKNNIYKPMQTRAEVRAFLNAALATTNENLTDALKKFEKGSPDPLVASTDKPKDNPKAAGEKPAEPKPAEKKTVG